MLKLYACGFNAWNQLRFQGSLLGEPPDLWHLEMLLENVRLGVRHAGLTSTIVETASGLRLAGTPDDLTNHIQANSSHQVIAEAGNGKIALVNVTEDNDGKSHDSKIREYKSWTPFPQDPSAEWDLSKIKQVVAGRTFFVALSEQGEVWTWGDPRYKACLGRDVIEIDGTSDSKVYHHHPRSKNEDRLNHTFVSTQAAAAATSPSHKPSLVSDLASLPTGPIVKIAAGGYIAAALTAGKDLYVWGVDDGEYLHLDGQQQPTPLDLGDQMDVLDVGVGDGHVIVLTEAGDDNNRTRRVLVIGKGANGQLGMGEGVEEVREWKEIELDLEPGWRPQRVGAGPRCSFVIVTNKI